MKKFILLYKGPATPMGEMTKEQSDQAMAAWGQWIQKVGDAMVEVGSPMTNGKVVAGDGSSGTPSQLNGYSIVQAENIDDAAGLVDGHPFLSDGTANFSIEVFELVPMSM